MRKRLLRELADEYGRDFATLDVFCEMNLEPSMITGKGKRQWINEDGQIILSREFDLSEVIPKMLRMKVVKQAPNPKFVYGLHPDTKLRVPVMIRKQMAGKLVDKMIPVEVITDSDGGVSYRCTVRRFL